MAAFYEISKTLTLEMGHRLPNHSGKCSNIHGHSYLIELFLQSNELKSTGSTEGMVEDYSSLKTALAVIDTIFDHTLVLSVDDPILPSLMVGGTSLKASYIQRVKEMSEVFHTFSGIGSVRLVLIKRPPTAEVLGTVWLYIIQQHIYRKLYKISVKETATSCATILANVDYDAHLLSCKDGKVS